MRRPFPRSLLALLVVLLGPSTAGAVLLSSFEVPLAVDGVTTVGNAYVVDESFNAGNFHNDYALFLSTFPNGDGLLGPLSGSAIDQTLPASVATATVESFLGLAAGSLDAISPGAGNPTVEGSAAQLGFTVVATSDLTLDVLLMSNETDAWAPDFTDFFFTTLTGEGAVERLNVADDPLAASTTIFDRDTGWATITWTGLAPGSYTLGFGVMDVQDSDLGTAVLVDAIFLLSEAHVAWMLSAGLVGIWLIGRPRRS